MNIAQIDLPTLTVEWIRVGFGEWVTLDELTEEFRARSAMHAQYRAKTRRRNRRRK